MPTLQSYRSREAAAPFATVPHPQCFLAVTLSGFPELHRTPQSPESAPKMPDPLTPRSLFLVCLLHKAGPESADEASDDEMVSNRCLDQAPGGEHFLSLDPLQTAQDGLLQTLSLVPDVGRVDDVAMCKKGDGNHGRSTRQYLHHTVRACRHCNFDRPVLHWTARSTRLACCANGWSEKGQNIHSCNQNSCCAYKPRAVARMWIIAYDFLFIRLLRKGFPCARTSFRSCDKLPQPVLPRACVVFSPCLEEGGFTSSVDRYYDGCSWLEPNDAICLLHATDVICGDTISLSQAPLRETCFTSVSVMQVRLNRITWTRYRPSVTAPCFAP